MLEIVRLNIVKEQWIVDYKRIEKAATKIRRWCMPVKLSRSLWWFPRRKWMFEDPHCCLRRRERWACWPNMSCVAGWRFTSYRLTNDGASIKVLKIITIYTYIHYYIHHWYIFGLWIGRYSVCIVRPFFDYSNPFPCLAAQFAFGWSYQHENIGAVVRDILSAFSDLWSVAFSDETSL
jgi:hypothetical protein